MGPHHQSSVSPLSPQRSLSPNTTTTMTTKFSENMTMNTNGYHHPQPFRHQQSGHHHDQQPSPSPFQNVAVRLDMNMEAHSMTLGDIIGELFSNKTHGRNLRRATPLIWC